MPSSSRPGCCRDRGIVRLARYWSRSPDQLGPEEVRTFLLHLGGKIEMRSKVPLRTRDELSMAYTPGVARVSMANTAIFYLTAPTPELVRRAMEAAYKALSGNELARGIGWRDVEVLTRDDGAPMLRLHGRALERFTELGAKSVHVSLTHSLTTAIGVVIVEG